MDRKQTFIWVGCAWESFSYQRLRCRLQVGNSQIRDEDPDVRVLIGVKILAMPKRRLGW